MAPLYASKPFAELTEADWDRQLSVDLRASFRAHAAAAHMKKSGGRIINFAGLARRDSRPRHEGYLPYYVAKAGVKALTEALATELAARSDPGERDCPGADSAPPDMSAEESSSVAKSTPLGRWGGEADIVEAVSFLVGNRFCDRGNHSRRWGRHLK